MYLLVIGIRKILSCDNTYGMQIKADMQVQTHFFSMQYSTSLLSELCVLWMNFKLSAQFQIGVGTYTYANYR